MFKIKKNAKEQYFENFINLSKTESFVDCGAFTGDTVQDFFNATAQKYGGGRIKIYTHLNQTQITLNY